MKDVLSPLQFAPFSHIRILAQSLGAQINKKPEHNWFLPDKYFYAGFLTFLKFALNSLFWPFTLFIELMVFGVAYIDKIINKLDIESTKIQEVKVLF